MNQKCKQYLLKKILIRIDYEQVSEIDIDKAVQNVRKQFFEKEYKLYQNTVPITSLKPEEISTPNELNNIQAVNLINESVKEYQFIKFRETIKFSNKWLIIEDLVDNDYKGSLFYINNIALLIGALYDENPFMIIQRIGLRKIDSLTFKNISNIGKYFDAKVFNQNVSIDKYKDFGNIFDSSNSRISIISKEKACKANIMTDIQTGEYHNIDTEECGQAVQAVLDIDMYKDSFDYAEKSVDYIISIYKILNTESYAIYKSALTTQFYNELLTGTVKDTDILGGVFDVQNCD